MAKDNSLNVVFFLIGSGSVIYYKSFIKNKLRRRILDTPSSKIGSAALGSNVEIEGRVLNMADDGVVSPLSEVKGAAFIWSLEEYVTSGKNNRWVHRFTFYSTPYLYVHDGEEHTAAIDLSACEFQGKIFNHTVEFDSRAWKIPEKVRSLLSDTSMLNTTKKDGFFSSQAYRLREKVFTYDEKLYILGTATTCPDRETPSSVTGQTLFGSRENGMRKKITDLFNKNKTDTYTISQYDSNRNLVLDKTEEANLLRDIEKNILAQHGKSSVNEYVKKAKLLFTNDNFASGMFKLDKVYLSTKSEKKLSRDLILTTMLGLIGGPILIAMGVFFLILKFSH